MASDFCRCITILASCIIDGSAALAQLVRAPDCGSGGPPFEPGRRYHPRSNSNSRVEIGPDSAHLPHSLPADLKKCLLLFPNGYRLHI